MLDISEEIRTSGICLLLQVTSGVQKHGFDGLHCIDEIDGNDKLIYLSALIETRIEENNAFKCQKMAFSISLIQIIIQCNSSIYQLSH